MKNEAYAEYVHWRDLAVWQHGYREFVVMWSDHTWDAFKCPIVEYQIKNKTYKQFMQLNKIVSSKMSKTEATAFINRKFKEYEES